MKTRKTPVEGKKGPVEYWTMHWWGYGTYQRCSRHKTYQAALSAAKKCERVGGSPHDIWACQRIPRADLKGSCRR
jgi:hypothetical protein